MTGTLADVDKLMDKVGKACHAGQILGNPCRVDSSSWRRICQSCVDATQNEPLQCPKDQLRMLRGELGTFSSGRNFYVSWHTPQGVADSVKPFRMKDEPGALLLLFPSAEAAAACDTWPGVERLPGEMLTEGLTFPMRMCARAKSFCPSTNFSPSHNKTCLFHMSIVQPNSSRKRVRTPSGRAPPPLPEGGADSALGEAEGAPPAAGPRRARALPSPAAPEEGSVEEWLEAMLDMTHDSDDGSDHSGSSSTQLDGASSDAASTSAHSGGMPMLPGYPTPVAGGPSSDSRRPPPRPPVPPTTGAMPIASANYLPAALPALPAQPVATAAEAVSAVSNLSNLSVHGSLFVAHDTVKASGSPMWTVLSDRRLKTDIEDFVCGLPELESLRPKIFRYNGLGGTEHKPGQIQVGLMAQEVPPALSRYCRQRTAVRMHPDDAELTEVFMLDHSCLPFLCINAIKEHEERLAALEGAARQQEATEAEAARQAAQQAAQPAAAAESLPCEARRLGGVDGGVSGTIFGVAGVAVALVSIFLAMLGCHDDSLCHELLTGVVGDAPAGSATSVCKASLGCVTYLINVVVLSAVCPRDTDFSKVHYAPWLVATLASAVHYAYVSWGRRYAEVALLLLARRGAMLACVTVQGLCTGLYMTDRIASPWTIVRFSSGFWNGGVLLLYSVLDDLHLAATRCNGVLRPANASRHALSELTPPDLTASPGAGTFECVEHGRTSVVIFRVAIVLILLATAAAPKNRVALHHFGADAVRSLSALAQRS